MGHAVLDLWAYVDGSRWDSIVVFFFLKQKTAYEMRISDWSSDVCSSDLPFPLSLSAITAAGTPLQLRLSATPQIEGNTLQLNNVNLHLSQGSATTQIGRASCRERV